MNLLKCLLSANRCMKTTTYIKPKGVMVHSTGANNPYIRRYVQPLPNGFPTYYNPDQATLLELLGVNRNHNDWNRPNIDACVHAFIGKLADDSVGVCQTLPWEWRGWHAGTGTSGQSANDTHISFEICEDDLTDPVYFKQAYRAAVELTAELCRTYNLDPLADGVIICHQDGYKRGIASNHGDIYNWFPKHGKDMDTFRADVVKQMEGDADMVIYPYLDDVPEYYRDAVEKVIDKGALQGVGDGAIDVSEDLCRTLTILDRLGKLD